jgi:hypothetical protein
VASLHCCCAADACQVTNCEICGAPIPEADKRYDQHQVCLPCKGARIPSRFRFQAGDRVQLHGYVGYYQPPDLRATGFRGVVEGYIGGTILIGLCDNGREWAEYAGKLKADGTPRRDPLRPCTCCPPPAPKPVQLDLFAAVDGG